MITRNTSANFVGMKSKIYNSITKNNIRSHRKKLVKKFQLTVSKR